MRCARTVLLALILVAGSVSPPALSGQDSRGPPAAPEARAFYLEQNYPNPVNPETVIPFHLEEELFDGGETGVVTLRIVNVLRQLVAIPVATDHPRGEGTPVLELPYTDPGRKLAFWDGKDLAGRPVPSGVYYCLLIVEGQPQPQIRKLLVVQPEPRRKLIPWLPRPRKPRWIPWFN